LNKIKDASRRCGFRHPARRGPAWRVEDDQAHELQLGHDWSSDAYCTQRSAALGTIRPANARLPSATQGSRRRSAAEILTALTQRHWLSSRTRQTAVAVPHIDADGSAFVGSTASESTCWRDSIRARDREARREQRLRPWHR